jgi:PAS domain S-box-containing protein
LKDIPVKKWKIGNTFPGLAALLVVLMILGVTAFSTVKILSEAWRWEKHTYEVSSELGVLLSNLVDVETAERGYVISGDPQFLEPSNLARPQVDRQLQNLRRLTNDNALQQRRLEQLGPLIKQRLAEAERLVGLRASGNAAVALSGISAGKGKQLMDAIRQIIANMENEEHRLLTERDDTANVAVQRLQGTLLGSGVLGVLIIVISVVLMTRENRKRLQAELSASRTLGILDFTLDGVLMFRASTLRFFYANHGSVQQLGYSREELLGMSPLDLEPGLDSSGYRATIAPLIGGNIGSQTRSALYHRKDGLELPVEIVLQAGEIVDGEQVMVAIVRDITARREADAVRQLYQERLEEKVQQRTVELAVTNERMRVERRKAEEAVREEEERFRTMANSIPQLAWIARADGHTFWYNQRWYEYTGTKLEQMEGWGWQSVLDPLALPKVLEQWQASIAMGEFFEMEFSLRGANGLYRSFLACCMPLKDAEGHLLKWFGTDTDISARKVAEEEIQRLNADLERRVIERTTQLQGANDTLQTEIADRKRSEDHLQESEEAFRILAELVPQLVWMCLPDGMNVYFNQRWVDYTGLTLEKSYGRGWNDPFHRDDKQAAWDAWNRAVATGGEYAVECRLLGADGGYRWFLTRGLPLRDGAGFIVKWFGTCTDIDDLKRAEAEIRALNAALERRVVERTAQLQSANVELNAEIAGHSQAREKIHELNAGLEQRINERTSQLQNAAAAKDQFLANMSHELRTPLNGIIGFAEFLVDGKPGMINPKQKECLEDILNSGQHLLLLINDILDLAKVGAGKMELNPERFSLRKAIEEACAIAQPIAQKKSIHIEVAVAPEIGDVVLDQQKFKQVIYNLVSNAIKFTYDGGQVKISVEPHEPDCFTLVVLDTGIGIKAENLGRLFRAFEQLESGASRHYEGTGLGLALTRKIVELQGGTIGVESELGKGSRFAVVLPLVTAKLNED